MGKKQLTSHLLLDKDGNLIEEGYSLTPIKKYSRDLIKKNKSKIKEWDYYYIGDNNFGIDLKIKDCYFYSICSISFFDFKNKKYIERSSFHLLSKNKINLPTSSKKGNLIYKDRKLEMHFNVFDNKRHLYGSFKNFYKKKNLSFDFNLFPSNDSSIVVSTPFNNRKYFCYSQKINCLLGAGIIYIGDKTYNIEKACGLLDFTRGLWKFNKEYFWASCSFIDENNNSIGFNLSSNFGKENDYGNICFYNQESYILNDIKFNMTVIKKEDYLSSIEISSSNKDVKLYFYPIFDKKKGINLYLFNSRERQVFGYYEGYFLVNNKKIEINSRLGFVSKYN